MKHHAAGFFIRTEDVSDALERLGLDTDLPSETIDGEAALAGITGFAVGRLGRWTAVICRDALPLDGGSEGASFWTANAHAAFLELSEQARLVSFVLEDASETYGFAIYDKGRLIRAWLSVHDEVRLDEGKPVREPEDRNDQIPLGVVFHKLETEVGSMQRMLVQPFMHHALRNPH